MVYNSMKKLIERKFYETKEQAIGILDVFFMAGRINEAEYLELVLLAMDVYDEVEYPEEVEEPEVPEDPEVGE